MAVTATMGVSSAEPTVPRGFARAKMVRCLSDQPPASPTMPDYRFAAELWRSPGEAGWCFVTLPHDVADEVDECTADRRTGFGSVRVKVSVGSTTWNTSLFPDTKAASYLLPVKRAVRNAERLSIGDAVTVELDLIEP